MHSSVQSTCQINRRNTIWHIFVGIGSTSEIRSHIIRTVQNMVIATNG